MGSKPEEITNPKIAAVVQKLADQKGMPRAIHEPNSFSKLLQETITAPWDRPELPGPAPQIITQADIDREVEKLNQQKAHAAHLVPELPDSPQREGSAASDEAGELA